MNVNAGVGAEASANMERNRSLIERLLPKGRFQVEHWRDGKCIGKYDVPNGVTNSGKNHMLDVTFHGTTPVSPWYLGLVNNSGFTAFAAADTPSSHAGWTELTSYDEANRVTWVEDAAASQAIANTTLATFTISATVAIKGVFLISENTKGGTTGTLWCTAAFASVINAVDNDVLKVTFTVSLT